MKKINTTILIIAALLVGSVLVFSVQLFMFQSPHDTLFYFLQDMAFLPLQVAIVTVVLGKVLSDREKKDRLKKTNMIVGAFFSEVGDEALRLINHFEIKSEALKMSLKIKENWSAKDFKKAADAVEAYNLEVSCTATELESLRVLLSEKRGFMLLMLANPNLQEHEAFTDLLWSVFHLTEELQARGDLKELPESDLKHLNLDLKRVFNATLSVWVIYMAHLKSDYPYLFSLELRRNPFIGDSSVIVK